MSKNGAQKELTTAQHRALASLLVSKNVRAAAEASGIAERTLWRWLEDTRFALALSAAEGQAVDAAVRRLVGLQDKAVDVLEKVLDDEEALASLKLRAAIAVLEQLIKLRELRNVESRLAALETRYATEL